MAATAGPTRVFNIHDQLCITYMHQHDKHQPVAHTSVLVPQIVRSQMLLRIRRILSGWTAALLLRLVGR